MVARMPGRRRTISFPIAVHRTRYNAHPPPIVHIINQADKKRFGASDSARSNCRITMTSPIAQPMSHALTKRTTRTLRLAGITISSPSDVSRTVECRVGGTIFICALWLQAAQLLIVPGQHSRPKFWVQLGKRQEINDIGVMKGERIKNNEVRDRWDGPSLRKNRCHEMKAS